MFREKIRNYMNQNRMMMVILPVIALYYGFLMFHIKPWYDELYTYYSFISRGPVYAAIHWPVPNNHVLYSVLSAFLDFFGNSYIGLRGISWIAAVLNCALLYELSKKIIDKSVAVLPVLLYVSAYQINNLSVQGRGYTLTISFYLIAILNLYAICKTGGKKINYILFALSLTGGLYAIVSSTFWVLPVCFTGGFVLLYQKKYKTLGKLILAALVAAFMTLFLYSVIWLAIGSNLLCKNPESIYYGIYQIDIILQAPFKALQTGMEYMLATPYIQGDSRSYIIAELFNYLSAVFHLHYLGWGEVLTVFLFVATAVIAFCFIKNKQFREKYDFGCIYFITSVVMLPLMLIIQSVQPYYRVFSFFSVPLVLLMVFSLNILFSFIQNDAIRKNACLFTFVIALIFSGYVLMRTEYHSQYAGRENEIAEITKEYEEDLSSIFYMDDFQKYVFKFYYDLEPQLKDIGEAKYLLVPKEVYNEDYVLPNWPTLYGHENVPFEQLEKDYEIVEESANYYLYRMRDAYLDKE